MSYWELCVHNLQNATVFVISIFPRPFNENELESIFFQEYKTKTINAENIFRNAQNNLSLTF